MGSRLGDAMSPYLRAHASNPVDWYPWGEAAFEAARQRDVPVLISVGYATCHWCHVMARESFSDPAVAAVLNDGFVAIKVDREEHPDVDASYLAAASAFTRDLGWPLTVFASPEGRAFYAGTYFPPHELRGAPSFTNVLAAVSAAWRDRRAELDATASAVAEALAAASAVRTEGALPRRDELEGAVESLAAQEDRVHGGFGGAPKFPVAPVLEFLTAAGGSGRALAERTVRLMGASPLHDPVDGGFFRYATQADWSEPHYERMLTDNALLLRVATELGRAWPSDKHTLSIADGIARFLIDRLQLPSGGFASAQDSESMIDGERSEGGYYRQDSDGRARLAPPPLDEKVLTGWNGLAIAALARHGLVRGDSRSVEAARRGAELLLATHVRPDGSLVRASRDGLSSTAVATLEDTGMFAGGLLELAAVTGEPGYAVAARALVDAAMAAASTDRDRDGGLPFATPGGGDPVLRARGLQLPDDPAEGAAPSGFTACADAAWRLHLLGAGDAYLAAAEQAMSSVAGIALERPLAFGGALALMTRLAAPAVQLVTVVPERVDGDREQAETDGAAPEEPALVAATRAHEASVVVIVDERQAREFAEAGFSLFDERTARNGKAVAYRCEAFVCALPVEDPSMLGALGPLE
ncbi:thioredoxin domain-containing protein [Agromyces sp. NPDC056379]|uniref:thioredoxin domain-containing protein n=1 Tax=unclassified Agromyces TaxID=2639701 RepID=UPI0035E1ED17